MRKTGRGIGLLSERGRTAWGMGPHLACSAGGFMYIPPLHPLPALPLGGSGYARFPMVGRWEEKSQKGSNECLCMNA